MKGLMRILKIVAKAFAFAVLIAACTVAAFAGTFYYFTGSPTSFIKFFRTFYIVENQYAGAVDKSTLMEGALEGIVAKLEDRHSLFMDGKTFENFSNQTTASYGGVGIYLGVHNGSPIVIKVIEGEPAEQEGVQRGDVITAIDGTAVDGLSLKEISTKIRGPVGSSVSMTLQRDGEEFSVTLERKQIHLKTVAGDMIPDSNIGYIQIAVFSENTGKEFTELFQSLQQRGMEKLVLDLRNNPGGLLDQAVIVANSFVPPDSTLLSYTDRNGKEMQYTAAGTDQRISMAVLVNENSASAAEIIAGAVQDLELGSIVGVTTYGKGTVQGVYPLDQADAIKLTVAKYKTAKGRIIDGIGIEPDVYVPLEAGDTADRQFEKAVELLKQ